MRTIYCEGVAMKEYIIKQIDKKFAKYVVFGITVDSPLFQLTNIQKCISLTDGDNVVFDQLLQTGNTENRFLIMSFLNGEFNLNSAQNIEAQRIDIDIKSFGCNFLRNNKEVLRYSILLSEQKDAILNGRNI